LPGGGLKAPVFLSKHQRWKRSLKEVQITAEDYAGTGFTKITTLEEKLLLYDWDHGLRNKR
jgi:hypothetical protein